MKQILGSLAEILLSQLRFNAELKASIQSVAASIQDEDPGFATRFESHYEDELCLASQTYAQTLAAIQKLSDEVKKWN